MSRRYRRAGEFEEEDSEKEEDRKGREENGEK